MSAVTFGILVGGTMVPLLIAIGKKIGASGFLTWAMFMAGNLFGEYFL